MSRRRTQKKRIIPADPLYKNVTVELFVRQIMREGKKNLAYKIFYKSLNLIYELTKKNPIFILNKAVINATPLVEIRASRVRGSILQLPQEVQSKRGTILAVHWILNACRKKSGKPMYFSIANELISASKKAGNAVKKKEEVHRMAESNKAFAKRPF
jgi:small subunit ribosomal protein S7|uniref:ribosomal protein S7 n=1 Tax=Prototheca lentecrescens TaxID=2836214 RepID=UPI003001859F